MTAPGEEEVDQEAMMADWEAAEGGEDAPGEDGGGEGGGGDEGGDQDDLAAEWEASLGAEDGDEASAPAPGRESTRVLNQDEIDSLLGFDEEHDAASEMSGIQAILNCSNSDLI